MKGTHLTLEDRKFIQHELEEEKSRAQIAKELGKSPSTISKEVKLHRKIRPRNVFNAGVGYFCENRGRSKDCVGCKRCESACPTDFLSVRVYLGSETTRSMGLAY